MLLKKPPEFWTNKPLGNPGRFTDLRVKLEALTTRIRNWLTRPRLLKGLIVEEDNILREA